MAVLFMYLIAMFTNSRLSLNRHCMHLNSKIYQFGKISLLYVGYIIKDTFIIILSDDDILNSLSNVGPDRNCLTRHSKTMLS